MNVRKKQHSVIPMPLVLTLMVHIAAHVSMDTVEMEKIVQVMGMFVHLHTIKLSCAKKRCLQVYVWPYMINVGDYYLSLKISP